MNKFGSLLFIVFLINNANAMSSKNKDSSKKENINTSEKLSTSKTLKRPEYKTHSGPDKRKTIKPTSGFDISERYEKIIFTKKIIKLNNKSINVEIADTQKKRNRGLMNRSKLEKNHGMLFIFKDELTRSFWMKNTFIPLDIAFFNKDKTLIEVSQMIPMKSVMDKKTFQYESKKKAMYVLEVNKGWLKSNGIKLGAKISID